MKQLTGKETVQILKSDPKFQGITIKIDTRTQTVYVGGTLSTSNPEECEKALEEMGFAVILNGAKKRWPTPKTMSAIPSPGKVAAMPAAQQAAAAAIWEQMVTGR